LLSDHRDAVEREATVLNTTCSIPALAAASISALPRVFALARQTFALIRQHGDFLCEGHTIVNADQSGKFAALVLKLVTKISDLHIQIFDLLAGAFQIRL
jgi:hypothetical protein